MTAPIISFQDIFKSFGSKEVLKGVNLDINAGESFVLIGRSGSGKSVLLKCLLGLIPIDRGVILMDQWTVHNETRRQRKKRLDHVGMVFQSSALFDSLTVWENIAFGLVNAKRMPVERTQALALEKLKAVGLKSEAAYLFPAEISGGMQRRVALARAIALDPPFLFFDEPTAGLDPIFSSLIGKLITQSINGLNATSITITHDLRLARTIGDRIGMLYKGEIIWQGPKDQLDTCDNPIVRQFVEGETTGPIRL